VYVALCYYKLDYYDVSLELLAPYLQQVLYSDLRAVDLVSSSRSFISAHYVWLFSQCPDSVIATNLKACNQYKLFDGQAAEAG